MSSKTKLYYVYDPMCSWCWGYKPTWNQIEQALTSEVEIVYLVGGLAPDSDVPMPIEMQQQIASYWKKIENYLGTEFNYDFWQKNTPRRSTYPSCRAVLAARLQDAERPMLKAIQHAYYLNAKNPSDNEILIQIAQQIGLDSEKFAADLVSEQTNQNLLNEISFTRSLGNSGFPSLFLEKNDTVTELKIDYQNANNTISQVQSLLI
ncbi:DsbA family protein [Vibrio sp. TH_r3]|uniref:DsbA family protein n=1 Tax=Vibrio sp. TH_r3 TaxID=3082084 RepID=UPI0029559239|nr:DsbA family protein [Vibrio sp. TH_r3]MDV7103349.1 DsbA family protein [Vibrio sp. TH_r3]